MLPIFLLSLFFVLTVLVIVLLIRHSNKKKKEKEVQYRETQFLLSHTRNLANISLPENFFKAQYMCWMDDDVPTERRIASYYEMQKIYQEAADGFDIFEKSIKLLDKAYKSTIQPIFFTSQEEWDHLASIQTPDLLEKFLSQNTVEMLPIFAFLRTEFSRWAQLGSLYFKISENQDPISLAQQTYPLALEIKWSELCASYPQYNSEYYHKRFCECAKQDDYSFENWQNFFIQSFLDTKKEFGATGWIEQFLQFTEKINQLYNFIISHVNGEISEYSSLYEISDFDSDEVARITALYKNGTISGIYKKEKDPKYNGAAE